MPSYQNQEMQKASLKSLVYNTSIPFDNIKLFDENINYGWMKACNMGIKESPDVDYIVLSNDDIIVPAVCDWARVMIDIMDTKKEIGALSVLSYNVAGASRLNNDNCLMKQPYEVPWCVFFFIMLRNEAIKKIGLLDEDLPGGDDLDYCMRLREAGYKIAVTPQVFIWHHYGQTGKKVYNDWDSEEHEFNISRALIRKHGFKKYVYNKYGG